MSGKWRGRLKPLTGKQAAAMTDTDYIARLKSNTKLDEHGCWIWLGFRHMTYGSPNGYGEANCRGKQWRVHRLMYTLTKGPIPDGFVVMHLCDNSICINPDHLQAGTPKDNSQDCSKKGRYGYHRARYKFCKHGHEFTPENTRICSRGFRNCRECERLRCRRYWATGKAKERQKRNRAKRRVEVAGVSP